MDRIPKYILLYDGDCGFCNKSVAVVLKKEKHHDIHFSAIQSPYTAQLFERNGWPKPDLNTFYFINGDEKFERSSAAFEVMKQLKAPTSWWRVFRFLPTRFNDACYNFVAKRRKKISKGFCVLPSPVQRKRFLT